MASTTVILEKGIKKMNTKRRVLIVLENTGRGGAETQALNLSRGLIAKGFDVSVISFGSVKGAYWDSFSELGANVHLTKFNAKLVVTSYKGIKNLILNWRYSLKLIRLIRKINPDTIIPFTYKPNIILSRLWTFTAAKTCYWNQRDEGRLFTGNQAEIKNLNRCTKIISNSLEGVLFLKQFTNKPIIMIHNGVVLPEKTVDYEVSKKRIRVVMVANLHSYKDHQTLLKAWQIVVNKKSHAEVELVLAGKDGDKAINIKNFIKDNNLSESVSCLGMITNVPELLLSCDIGVLSSVKEGLPNGILECMAVGLTVVATKINGSIEALGKNSPFLVEPHNEIDLASKLLQLIDDADLRKQTGLGNRERIKEYFAMDIMINNYISELKN
jgi:glycosyltransferase involved in cell wall biosynthesis